MESWAAIIAIWVFLSIFLLLGFTFLITAFVYAFWSFKGGPALVHIRERELNHEDKLIAKGFIPRYLKKEKRESIDVELVCYRVSYAENDVYQDFASVEKLVSLAMKEKQLQYSVSDKGTKFQLECALPSIDDKHPQQEKPGNYCFWRLEIEIEEQIIQKGRVVKEYDWEVGFPLPINLA